MERLPFVCPICRGSLERDGGSARCARQHVFDVARQGYLNLLRRKPDTLYEDKSLFLARRAVYEAGFFAPLAEAIAGRLSGAVVLDAGCGEGSLLAYLCAGAKRVGIGLDIAKEAVKMAAGSYKRFHWCVGDLCDIPLADGSVDSVVNVLTPANYGEFSRVLAKGGVLLKIVPNAEHLAEIRCLAGKSPYAHSLAETLRAFERQFTLAEQKAIRYKVACDEALSAAVYAMTPLTAYELRPKARAGEITVDLTLLVGRMEAVRKWIY